MEQLTICVPGTLAIQSNAGEMPTFFNSTVTLQGARAAVTYAPAGAAVVLKVVLESSPQTTLFTLTISAGETAAVATGSPVVPANTNVRLDITAVGTTFPGQYLTVNLF